MNTPLNVLVINYHVYGQSSTEPTVEGLRQDVLNAYVFTPGYKNKTGTKFSIEDEYTGAEDCVFG